MRIKAAKCVDLSIRRPYKIDDNVMCVIEKINPNELIVPERLDVIAKIAYLRYKELCPSLADDIYKESIRIVTNGTFIEYGNEEKNSYETFKRMFDETEQRIQSWGYDENNIVPVDENGIIMDGAHRLAIAFVQNLKINVARVPVDSRINYDAYYFRKRMCDEKILDILLTLMIELMPDLYIANIWPSAVGKTDQIEFLFKENDIDIIYNKTVNLNDSGAYSYVYQIYYKEDWSGEIENGFSGTNRKSVPCFSKGKDLRIYLLRSASLDKIVNAKMSIREIFNIGNHSIHITDTHEQAIQMSKLLFNDNSITFMNYGNPLKYKKSTRKTFDFSHSYNNVTITGSSVMELYGICDANDVDYFCGDNASEIVGDSHNQYLSIYGLELGDVLYDQRNFFYYLDIRVLSLKNLYDFKKNRLEGKDKVDIKLMENKFREEDGGKSKAKEIIKDILRRYRTIITRIQIWIIKFSHRTGTYVLLRDIYHKVVDKK